MKHQRDAMEMANALAVVARKVLPFVWSLVAAAVLMPVHAASPAELLALYQAQSGAPAQAERGQRFFVTRHGSEWSCASCHGQMPTQAGRHASTGKVIQPLAPAAHAERFSDADKAEKWFRRNCNDVLGRLCTPAEKADVLAWLQTLRP
jgi:cytochrome c553